MMKVVKHFTAYQSHLVSDPNSSLRTGDVVRIAPGWCTSKHVRHVVTEIVAPWGPPVEERPPVRTLEEMAEERRVKREAKMERRELRRTRGELDDGQASGEEPALEERHTDVIGGPEAVGSEERVGGEERMDG
ncbi:MAG: hypothetical protein Q9196_005173 [Gyalolechia fulgens]